MEIVVCFRSLIKEYCIPNAQRRTMVVVTGVRLPATMMYTDNGEIVNKIAIDFVSSQLALI